MANEDAKTLSNSWAMIGGDGPRSYAHNSVYQKRVVDAAKGLMDEGITNNLDFNNASLGTSNTFRISDFGCSVGSNTFFAIQNIIEAIDKKYHAQLQNPPPLELQVFFNDVIGNDFNALFKTLPFYQKYFAAGVPGSFYGRLFPKSSLHLGYSAYAMHWLSKIPKEIVDVNSPSWNKGSIQCTGPVKEVATAYAAQFKSDLDTFLNARAEEIVDGGLMIIIIGGLPDGILVSQTGVGLCYDLFGSSVTELVKLGLISEEKADSFNLPLYYATPKEVEEIVKSNGHFSIEKMDKVNTMKWSAMKLSVEASVMQFRAIFDGVVKEHFGNEEIVDKIYEYFTKILADNYSSFDDKTLQQHINHFIVLKRNTN